MLPSIFQPEITTLESQIAALQAQITAHTDRIALLNETDLVAGSSLEALRGAIAKVAALAPDAIATLKSAVLGLFAGNDPNGGNRNGNQPIAPAPQPGFDNRTLHQKTLEDCRAFAAGDIQDDEKPRDNRTLHELALDACREYAQEQAIAVTEALNGQSTQWASCICCQLEDCPTSSLTGQSVELTCVVSDAPKEPEYVELVPLTHLVAYQRKTTTGEILCCYVGGNNKTRLRDWCSWLCVQHSVGSGFEVREAKRLTGFKWEAKIWGMSLKQIQRLAETDVTKTPPSRYHVASQPVAQRLLAPEVEIAPQETGGVAFQAETLGFKVGDQVEVISDRHGVELVGLTGTVTAGTKSGAAVDINNTLRYFCADELAAISTPASRADLEPTEEERVASASIQPPVLVPAYNPYPQGRKGAAANWKAYQEYKSVERQKQLVAAGVGEAVDNDDDAPPF